MSTFKIAPSILAADFTRLGAAIEEAEDGGADMIHVDVMDGHFVPNITMGPIVVAAAKRATSLPLDVHLMVEAPDRFVDAFIAAGADIVTVHVEVAPHLHRVLQRIREAGTRVGLAFNPLTPLTALEGALPYLDLALVMTVNPGFGGQDFIPASLGRIEAARRMRDRINPNCLIEVDGGVTVKTTPQVVAAGADVLVAGSAVFGGHASVADSIAAIREAGAA